MGVTMSQEFSIDGFRFVMNKYGAGKSVRLLAKLTKILGKPLAMVGLDVLAKGKEAILDMNIDGRLIGDAIESLAGSQTPEEFEAIIREIMDGMIVIDEKGNHPLNFDLDFQGRPEAVFKVLKEVLSFQYSSFLAGLGGITPAPPSKAKRIQAL